MVYNHSTMMKKSIFFVFALLIVFSGVLFADNGNIRGNTTFQETAKEELSSVEKAYRDIGIEEARDLKQYGYDLFGEWKPAARGPLDRSYIVGPGDVLRLYIWGDPVEFGDLESTYEITVEEDGRMFFPPVGRLSVWGSSIGRVTDIITERLRERHRNFEVDIVPAEVRQISIFVSGFVHKPGMVTATSLWSVLDILSEAGGVSKDGSLRDVRLVRRDGETITVDLYNLFIHGKGEMPKIQEGDVIVVPPLGKVAASSGEVVRPGIYELKAGETIEDILSFSGGIRMSGARERGTLLRRDGEDYAVREGSILDDDFLHTEVEQGDLLLFSRGGTSRTNLVTMKGHVLYPGIYSLEKTQDLSMLLEKARLRPDTDRTFGTIERRFPEEGEDSYIVFNPSEILDPDKDIDYQLTYMDTIELYRKEITLPTPPIQVFGEIEGGISAYREGITLLDVLSSKRIPSPASYQARVIRDGDTYKLVLLRDLMLRGEKEKNVALNPGDKIVVVKNEEIAYDDGRVQVLGNVENPGVFEITPGMRLSDALEAAEGFSDRAFPEGMVVVRESVKKQQKEQFLQSAALLEKQIGQLAEAIAAQSLKSEVKITLQNQLVQQQTILDLARERSEDVLGRIALGIGDIEHYDEIRGTTDDLILEDGDYIFVPSTPGYIAVMGDIHSGLAVPYDPDKTVREYLQDVGSIDTRNQRIMILRQNGKIVHGERTFFGGTTLARSTLRPGDIIFAQRELKIPTGIAFRDTFMELVRSVGQIAQTIVLVDQATDVIW